MSELLDGYGGNSGADRTELPRPRPLDAAARAELRRSRNAVFGSGGALQGALDGDPGQAVDNLAAALGAHPAPAAPALEASVVSPRPALSGQELSARPASLFEPAPPFEPAPLFEPSGPLPAYAPSPVPLPAPYEVVAAPPQRDPRTPSPSPRLLGGLESVPLPTAPSLVCDSSDRIVRVNPALLELAGRTIEGAAGLFGMRLPQLVVGPDADARLVRTDGTLVRVRVLRWDVPGRELRAVVLVEIGSTGDGAPSADRRWIGELERITGVGTWSYNLATGALARSASLQRLYGSLGLAPDPGPGNALEGDQVAMLCAELRSGVPTADHHVELELPGGQWLDCRAEVERAPDGSPVRLRGVVRDITALRTAQARVRRSGQRFTDLMMLIPGGVAIIDPGGRLVDANPALCALLDASLEELRGRPAAAFAVDPSGSRPAGALPVWLRLVRPGVQHGYTIDSVALRREDGTDVWCELTVSVTTTDDDGGWFWLVVCTDLTERLDVAEQLNGAARVDALTGLPNRDGVLETIDDLLAGRHGDRVAVVCGGLDDFGRVNSSLGYEAGDELLMTIADRLGRELPQGCAAARLSGDEFVVVCADHAAVGGPELLARRVAELLADGVTVGEYPVRLTASVGVAAAGRAGPTAAPTAADLLASAEMAMHEAKQRPGRDAVVLAGDGVIGEAAAALELEAELRAAIDHDGLTLHYQPVVGPDGVVRSAEALVRWPHPTRGLVSPGEFLPVAQRCGLSRELDLWVLRTATREAARWPAHDGQAPAVAVNLAGLLPGDPDFLPAVTGAVRSSGLAWDRLVLELVETSLVELPAQALAAMAELVGHGVRFAVDDFGTGYSSLSRLKELPVQIVKLDRAFVTGVAADPVDRAVSQAVVDLARAMGCATVAEGVETVEQLRVLRDLGVDAHQGWLFARALPAPQLRALLVGDRLPVPQ